MATFDSNGMPLSEVDYVDALDRAQANGDSHEEAELFVEQNRRTSNMNRSIVEQEAFARQQHQADMAFQEHQHQQSMQNLPPLADEFIQRNPGLAANPQALDVLRRETENLGDQDWDDPEAYNKLAARVRRHHGEISGIEQVHGLGGGEESWNLTSRDKKVMRNFGMNPNNKLERAEFMKNKRSRLLHEGD